jgi:hypothetical protein
VIEVTNFTARVILPPTGSRKPDSGLFLDLYFRLLSDNRKSIRVYPR